MATKRRGFGPPDLRGTLGTLVRSALQQVTGVRETLERGAREGKSRIDDYRSGQRRRDMLADLGEVVLELVRRGEIDAEQLPEARSVLRELDQLDDEGGSHAHSHSHDDDHHHHDHDHDHAMPPTRSRFDTRSAGRDERPRSSDDGTVSSGAKWAPPARAGRPTNVWRPPADYAPHSPQDDSEEPSPMHHAKAAAKKGGITFGNDRDDDSDLAEYMHPDDVPPKSDDTE